MHLVLAIFLAAVAAPTDTVAVEGAFPEVSVVATRLATPAAEAPVRVTVLGPETIESSGSRSVADLLEARSPASIRRYGPSGLASISLRGTGASQTLILLDGHRIADPQLGQLDLSLLPTLILDRVEIMHGAGSALHGTDGMGGVIDLRTLRPRESTASFTSTVGAYGERSAGGWASATTGRFGLVLAAEARTLDGDFPYFNPNAGVHGKWTRRDGADGETRALFARAEAELGRTTTHAALWLGQADRGIPGSIGAPSTARQEDSHVRVWGGTATQFRWGMVRSGGLIQRARLLYNADEGRTTLVSGEVEARIPARAWLLSGGLNAGVASADHPGLADEAREARIGAFVAATGEYGSLLVYPALRTDIYLRSGEAAQHLVAVSPRVGANVQPIPGLGLRLKASAGGAFRAPTFNDRFWRYAESNAPGGDPDLRPERGWSTDLGAHFEHGPMTAEVTAFGSVLRDQIVWRPATGGLYSPENVGRTETVGVELTARARRVTLGPALFSAGVSYSLTDARDRSNPNATSYGQPLRYVPRHQLTLDARASTTLAPRTALIVNAGVRYVSERPVRADGSLTQPAYLVADGRLSLTHRFELATITLTAAVDNLLDTDYAILRGYPMPPRHGRFTLKITL